MTEKFSQLKQQEDPWRKKKKTKEKNKQLTGQIIQIIDNNIASELGKIR